MHAAVVAGLLGHLGLREGDSRDYLGARNSRFVLAPGSVLSKRPPRWVVVAELVETSAAVRPDRRAHRTRVGRARSPRTSSSARYSEPHWDARRGAAMAYERVTLYGLPIVARRRVGYANVDPDEARELFIRHALVEGDWTTRHHFFRDNQALIDELAELEERARRRDLLVGDDEIFAFYDARVPPTSSAARHFDAWWKKQRHKTPDLLTLTRDDLLRARRRRRRQSGHLAVGDLALPVTLPLRAGRRATTASPCTSRSTCSPGSAATSSAGRCRRCARSS